MLIYKVDTNLSAAPWITTASNMSLLQTTVSFLVLWAVHIPVENSSTTPAEQRRAGSFDVKVLAFIVKVGAMELYCRS